MKSQKRHLKEAEKRCKSYLLRSQSISAEMPTEKGLLLLANKGREEAR